MNEIVTFPGNESGVVIIVYYVQLKKVVVILLLRSKMHLKRAFCVTKRAQQELKPICIVVFHQLAVCY